MKLTEKKAELLLMLVISARATSFMFSKLCLTTMDTFSLLALRFLLAAVLLFVFFHKRICQSVNKKTFLSGILIGALALVGVAFLTLQPVAQSRLSAEKAGTLCALSPLVAGIMGVVFLKEALTLNMLLGDLLILISLVL